MKTKLLFSAITSLVMLGASQAQTDAYGYTTVNATMGANYQNTVFVDLSANQLMTKPANTWDVAFYRNGTMSFGTRINDAQGIETYHASTDPTQWDNISIANQSSWGAPLYNPDITDDIEEGAFEQANLTCSILSTGWGCYNIGTHHIDGKSIYVLKYPDNSYIKFMITDYYGGYTFKYAKWNGSAWGNTVTQTIANGNNDTYFNYYSLINDAVVPNVEPAIANWDFMMTRYWTFYMGVMMYRMSGIIQSPRISVAKVTETQQTNAIALPSLSSFHNGITTIGHSWKPTSGLIPDIVYYIKENNSYYRLYFTENGGSATGNMYFKYKDITGSLSTSDINAKVVFGLYPNPAPEKQVTLLYDVKDDRVNNSEINIVDMSGKIVYKTNIHKAKGFFKKELDLSRLSAGVYLVILKTESHQESKKLILK